jgi:glycosyltransferase involved in cell wall biosynthesis
MSNISVILPYPNPHVLDWILKLKGKVELNIGCIYSTQRYRNGYFEEYDAISQIHYFYKSMEDRLNFLKELRKADILVTLGLFNKYLLNISKYCKADIKLIVLSETFNPINSKKNKLLRYLWCSLIRRKYPRIDFFCMGGINVKKYYLRFGFKCSTYYNFGYFPDLQFSISRDVKTDNKISIVYIGQLIPRKGIDSVLVLMEYLSSTLYNYQFEIIGDGYLNELVQERMKQLDNIRISYTGLIKNRTDLKRKLKEADMVFVPSLFDAWGAIVNEAVSQSCAVICSDKVYASGIMVKHGFNGFIFNYDKGNDFIQYFERYFNNIPLLNQHKRNDLAIYNVWNAQNVANEFYSLIIKGQNSPYINIL